MKMLNGFTINSLVVSGFKCFTDETRFDFGELTLINGVNKSGKSTIADAIAFAVTGQPFFGDRGIDRLANPDCGAIDVTMEFTDDAGMTHTLNRRRKGNTMTISMDGYKIRQTNLTEIFGERDVFLSIFNPLYFIEELADGGKTLLEKLLPPVSHETVLKELSGHIRALLENEKMTSPQTYLQNRRAEVRGLEDALIYQQGQDDALVKQIKDNEVLLADYRKQAEERGLTVDSSDCTICQTLYNMGGTLYNRSEEMYQSQYTSAIAAINAEINSLYDGYARLDKAKKDGKCPYCLQSTEKAESLDSYIAEIVSKGRELKTQLAEAEELDRKAKEVFEQFKAEDMARMQAEAAVLQERYENSQKLLDTIEGLEVWFTTVSVSTEKTDAIIAAIKSKKELITAAVEYISKRNELTFTGLPLNRVAISLYDVVKSTGEVKDTFKFTYEGRPYRWLSLSESIKAGLEIAELLKTLTGRCYPTFIDNGESINHLGDISRSGQFFYARVANQPLSVSIVGQQPTQAAA